MAYQLSLMKLATSIALFGHLAYNEHGMSMKLITNRLGVETIDGSY